MRHSELYLEKPHTLKHEINSLRGVAGDSRDKKAEIQTVLRAAQNSRTQAKSRQIVIYILKSETKFRSQLPDKALNRL